ncbi:hypothetical protein [Streptomyces sp. NPDC003667]
MEGPRAAGPTGVVFAVVPAAAIVLIRPAVPEGAEAVTTQATAPAGQRTAVRWALDLVPFAGIWPAGRAARRRCRPAPLTRTVPPGARSARTAPMLASGT